MAPRFWRTIRTRGRASPAAASRCRARRASASECDPDAAGDGATGNDRRVVRLAALQIEQILASYDEREPTGQRARAGRAEPGRSVVHAPVVTQTLSDEVA